jgi:hypothetical protein
VDYQSNSVWYPIASGKFIEYKVDTIYYTKAAIDTIVKIDTVSNFILEAYGDQVTDFGDSSQYQIIVYQRKNRLLPLNYYRTWSVRKNDLKIIKSEDELTYIKMTFPVNGLSKWYGNSLMNTSTTDLSFYKDWNYSYINKNQSFSTLNRTFESTTTIEQINDKNEIEWRYSFEVYAKNVGMIYSERRMVYKQDPTRDWDNPENGYIIRKSIVDWN